MKFNVSGSDPGIGISNKFADPFRSIQRDCSREQILTERVDEEWVRFLREGRILRDRQVRTEVDRAVLQLPGAKEQQRRARIDRRAIAVREAGARAFSSVNEPALKCGLRLRRRPGRSKELSDDV